MQSLLLVHVEEEPKWFGEPEFHLPSDIREVRLAHANAQLQVWKHDAIEQGVRDVDTMLTEGAAWGRLCAIARDDHLIGLVVLGTHGRTGLSRALIGSVAERVLGDRHASRA